MESPLPRLAYMPAIDGYFVDGARCALEPKCAQILRVLGEHSGRVVSVEALRNEVWGGRLIGDGVIPQAMLKLRKALNDDGRLIRNVRRRGYLLTAPIETIAAATAEPAANLTVPAQPALTGMRRMRPQIPSWLPVLGLLAVVLLFSRSLLLPGPGFGSPLAASAPILNAASTHALARQLSTALTPAAMDEAERLLAELVRVRDWEAIASADLARIIVLRYEFDGKAYGESLQLAQQALERADRLAPDADHTLYAQAVVAAMQGDLPAALAHFGYADAGSRSIPGFAADYAAVALQAGQLRLADELVEDGLEAAPDDPRLLLERAWLTQLRRPSESADKADALIGQARMRAPGMREADWVAIVQQLQRGQWPAVGDARRLPTVNAQDSRSVALAILVALHEADTNLLPGLLTHYVATDSGRDGRDLCLIWESLARAGKLAEAKALHALIAEVPESLTNGLWLRAYAADADFDQRAALALAQRAFELNVQHGDLFDLELPDFSMHRLGAYDRWLQAAGDASGMARLRDALAAEQQRLRAEGLDPVWADRLTLPVHE